MRMRKKKHTPERLAACEDITVKEIKSNFGKWNEISGGLPVHIEIGCGKGAFITELAKRNPDIFYIAFEKVPDVIIMAMEKVKEASLTNVLFACEDAEELKEVFAKGEVERIYLNFSDPWPKKKHAKRRLTSSVFLEIYKSFLKDSGEIIFKTDNRALFDFSLEEMQNFGMTLSDITFDLHNSQYNEGNIMTEYEKNFSEKGFSINRVVAKF